MTTKHTWFWAILIAIGAITGLCLVAIKRTKSARVKELGHVVLSCAPWVQILISCAVVIYVRIGCGSWPRSCIDSPDLPMLDSLLMFILLFGLLILYLIPLFWIGWLIIRIAQGFRRWWLASSLIFVSGVVAVWLLFAIDPFGFWEWCLG